MLARDEESPRRSVKDERVAEREREVRRSADVEPPLADANAEPREYRSRRRPGENEPGAAEELGRGDDAERQRDRPLRRRVVPLPGRPEDGGGQHGVHGGETEQRGAFEVDA